MNPPETAECLCGSGHDRPVGVDMARPQEPNSSQDRGQPLSVDGPAVAISDGDTGSRALPLEFRGSAREYFRIWIVNKSLTLLTLGIFSAWAKVRRKRYLYSHTTLGGTPFQYLGLPIPILKGRILAAAGFLLYYLSTHFFTYLLPYVIAAGMIAAPWVMVRSAAFNARYSAFRNMTFHFDGSYMDAFKVLYAWGVVALFIVAFIVASIYGNPKYTGIAVGVIALIFTLSVPWWVKRLKKFLVEHSSYGGRKGVFSATGGQFYKIFLLSALILLAVAIASVALSQLMSGLKSTIFPFVIIVPIYAGYVLAYAFYQSRSGNLVWNHTALGPIRFRSALRSRDLLKLYVTNALGIVASLGLLIPWAVMRTMKYRADTMRVTLEGELTGFEGSDLTRVGALGAETMEIFDMDFSL
ncbi:MAG TPA: YjgN family protein [Syntrophobacteraceae bacterium]|nr:YjgN family protein [Syntrophobacteraceae bacterium]